MPNHTTCPDFGLLRPPAGSLRSPAPVDLGGCRGRWLWRRRNARLERALQGRGWPHARLIPAYRTRTPPPPWASRTEELFRVYVSDKHRRGIHSETFAEELHRRGFSLDIDKHKIGYYLGENGYGIRTKQLKLRGINRNGYDWDACMPFFADHLSEEERDQIYQEWRGEEVDRGRGTPEKEMYF
jgi:hypothetical protein